MENNKYTFWRFLKEHKIEIPIIQRDYAQGRTGKEELRKSFLKDLKSALGNSKEMKLDFVYGTNENNRFNPLDGQQRLTTLWLFHWYIAFRLGKLGLDSENNNMPNEISRIFCNFTYETRVSSREFCRKLSVFNVPQPDGKDEKQQLSIDQLIQKQTWFRSAWKQDPTINAMLRMLSGTPNKDKKGDEIIDGIEEAFKDCTEEQMRIYWENLLSDSCPIAFYYLDLEGLKQSDDLYIKMNARGEQLTSFENFKADLIGYINEQANDSENDENIQKKWKELLNPQDGIPIKMDIDWTDIFWKNKSSDYRIDEIYFAFINRFFFNELFIAKKKDVYLLDLEKEDENNKTYRYLNDSNNPNDYDTKIAYNGLDVYKYDSGKIPLVLFEKIKNVLNQYLKYIKQVPEGIPECSWDKDFHFIPKYDENEEIENNAGIKIKKVTALNQVQRIVFFAVCKYLNEGEANEESLRRWMRVVWNLVSSEDRYGNSQIRSTSAMRKAIKFIDNLSSHNVYRSLQDKDISKSSEDFDLRCNEEINKAKKILDKEDALRKYDGKLTQYKGKTWEDIIKVAENYAFFHGAIRFLFTDENGNVDWTKFDIKYQNVQKYFDEQGVKSDYSDSALLLRSFIAYIDDFPSDDYWFWNNFHIYCNKSNRNSWRQLLLSNKYKYISKLLIKCYTIEELTQFTSSLKDERSKYCQEQLVRTLILDHVIENVRIRWNWGTFTLYPDNTKSMNNIYIISNRNEMLSSLGDDCDSEQKIDDISFYRGKNINFKFKNYHFQWYGTPDLNEADIYLMDENWDYLRRKNTDKNSYYCFKIEENDTVDSFKNKLNKLITEKSELILGT
jgi:hypothetical protein